MLEQFDKTSPTFGFAVEIRNPFILVFEKDARQEQVQKVAAVLIMNDVGTSRESVKRRSTKGAFANIIKDTYALLGHHSIYILLFFYTSMFLKFKRVKNLFTTIYFQDSNYCSKDIRIFYF